MITKLFASTFLFATALQVICPQSAHAGLAFPYKITKIECVGNLGTLQMIWNSSKSPYIYDIVVNNKSEIIATTLQVGLDTMIYAKADIFSIALSNEGNKALFAKEVMLLGQTEIMLCKQSDTWSIFQ